MNNERYKSAIAFTDLLFNILVGFAFLFIVAFLLIKPESKKKDFDRRAEFVIILEWDKESPDDIDLYVEDPLNGLVSFRNPRANFMHLDKDDLGSRNDSVQSPDGTVRYVFINREVVTIRGIMPGEYIVNAHYYSNNKSSGLLERYRNPDMTGDVKVKIELHKVNPYTVLWIGEKQFDTRGQEETFLRFRLNKKGEVSPTFTFEKKKFVGPLPYHGADSGNPSTFSSISAWPEGMPTARVPDGELGESDTNDDWLGPYNDAGEGP